MMLGEDGESHKDLYLQGISDEELADKISRSENMLVNPSKLPDGGAKLRVLLQRQVSERKRRKLLKADGKRTKTTLLADKPKAVSGYFEKRENAPRVQPIRNSKTNNIERPFVLVDEDELEVDAVHQSKLGEKVQLPISYLLNSLQDMGSILERMTISEQAQFGTALLGRALDAFASAHGGFLQLEAENKKLTQHNSVLVKDHKSCHAELNSLKSALAAQTARAELAQAERDSWLKEKEELIAAHQAELDAVKEKSRAEGYEQGQDELKGLQRPFQVGFMSTLNKA